MSDLPSFRLSPGSPFGSTSIDYFVRLRYGLVGDSEPKHTAQYLCLTARAIHLELVTNLTTDRFLMALRRFISIWAAKIYT